MKVGDRLFTRDGADFFYPCQIIEITLVNGTGITYKYLSSNGVFSRDLSDFEIKQLEKVSPVTELFYE